MSAAPTLDLVVDYSASTVTMLVLEDRVPCVRVMVDVPGAASASAVAVDVVTEEGQGTYCLEVAHEGRTVRVELPNGVDPDGARPKFHKRTMQLHVQLPLVSDVAAFVIAAGVGDVGALRTLYDMGLAPSGAVAPGGETPLIAAARRDRVEAVQLLLQKGADVAAKDGTGGAGDEGGRTALCWATWNCNERLVKLLLAAGASPNVADVNGETPLMVAARTGAVGNLQALLEAGAEVKARDGAGWTAIQKAQARGHQRCMEIINQFR